MRPQWALGTNPIQYPTLDDHQQRDLCSVVPLADQALLARFHIIPALITHQSVSHILEKNQFCESSLQGRTRCSEPQEKMGQQSTENLFRSICGADKLCLLKSLNM
jgi:hypothetical protein